MTHTFQIMDRLSKPIIMGINEVQTIEVNNFENLPSTNNTNSGNDDMLGKIDLSHMGSSQSYALYQLLSKYRSLFATNKTKPVSTSILTKGCCQRTY